MNQCLAAAVAVACFFCLGIASAQDLGSKPAAANRREFNSVPKYNSRPKYNTPPKANTILKYNSVAGYNRPSAKRKTPNYNSPPIYPGVPGYNTRSRLNAPAASNVPVRNNSVRPSSAISKFGVTFGRDPLSDSLNQDQSTSAKQGVLTIATTNPDPSVVELGTLQQGSQVRKKLVVRRPHAFQIVQIFNANPAVKVEPAEGEKSLHVLTISVSTSQPMAVYDRIIVVTNDPLVERSTFVVSGEVVSPILTDPSDSDIIGPRR